MRIAQIIVSGVSAYERKCQKLDFEALRGDHEVRVFNADDHSREAFDLVHVYGPPDGSRALLRRLRRPYVAASRPRKRLLRFLGPADPARVAAPLKETPDAYVPEAVDDAYFGVARSAGARLRIGSLARPSVVAILEQTSARLQRFRDDVEWEVFDNPPSPAEMASLAAWVDPAVADDDYDGFIAEAVAAGVITVAARTPINSQRLEHGRTGFLVPTNDPNELTHAILAALFKPEAAREREVAARQTASKYRVRQRLRALLALYESLSR